MSKLNIVVGIIVVVGLALWSTIFVVNERNQAIVTRFGEITSIKTEPGLYFKAPFIEAVQIIEDRLLLLDQEGMTVQVKGGKFYEVDAFLTYRISDARAFREKLLGSIPRAEARLGTRMESALRSVYGLRDFNDALSQARNEMMTEARDILRGDISELGLEVVDVRIRRTDLTVQVSSQTYDRMIAERLAEAALLRARGKERAQTIRAIADRQAVSIVADARRDSEILRGEGDAERNAIFASAFGQDVEFFEFYRSMQSYRNALESTGTTLILSPDSEFFRYFNSDTGE